MFSNMSILELSAMLVSLTAVFAWVNHRHFKLPTTIGVMVLALGVSLILVGLRALGLPVGEMAQGIVKEIEFDDTLLQGMLSFLLFAGALHVDLNDLAKQKSVIAVLASVGVLISTFMVGGLTYLLLNLLGLDMPFLICCVFGSLISPTDPIAVLGILKQAKVPKSLETKIAGESLFNDGVGVVIFLVLTELAVGHVEFSGAHVAKVFLVEAGGGALLGLLLGWITYRMLKSVDNYQVEVLLTLGLVMGGYALAMKLHASGPILVVVAGLLIGNQGRTWAMSETTRHHLDTFWELLDEILNAVLFVLIGLEILLLTWQGNALVAGGLSILVVLFCRAVSVGLPLLALKRLREFTPGAYPVLVWGGLRGGISVALVLSLPAGQERDLLLTMTYCVVVFSIVVQGLSMGRLVRRFVPASDSGKAPIHP